MVREWGKVPDVDCGGTFANIFAGFRASTLWLVATGMAVREATFYVNFMMELGFGKASHSVSVHIDNTSTLCIADNSTYSGRTRRMALRFYIREFVKKGRITPHYVPTASSIASIWLKYLPKQRHLHVLHVIKTFRVHVQDKTEI